MAADTNRIAKDAIRQADANTETHQRLQLLEACVKLLICQASSGQTWRGGYEEAGRFLESVPLATNEYNLAKLRLKNALDYCRLREFGAAMFELRALVLCLRRLW
jgi:hypothetical protein